MSWWLLALGIGLEVAGTVCMKISSGFEHRWATILIYVFYGLSLTSLTFAFRHIDISVAYAVWSGAGLVLIASIGMLYFREPVTVSRLVFLACIFVGLLGLHLSAQSSSQ